MKSNRLLAIVMVAGCVGLLGCKPREIKITGQMFIVTQGADNIKLGAGRNHLDRKGTSR